MMINTVVDYLEELYPLAKCELEYNKDYELLLAIMMSAQTTDKRVNMVNKVLFSRYDTLDKLNNASISDIENIIKPIGTYKRKALYIKEIVSKLISDNIEKIPNDRKYLSTLPGVGRKTINVFLSIIYNEPLLGVDTHVSRVSKRLGLAKIEDEPIDIEKKLMKKLPKDKINKIHHQLVFFGRYKCTSRSPGCSECKLKKVCKYYDK